MAWEIKIEYVIGAAAVAGALAVAADQNDKRKAEQRKRVAEQRKRVAEQWKRMAAQRKREDEQMRFRQVLKDLEELI